MPYKKSYRKVARKARAPQPWYKKRYNAMELATKAAQGVWYLKGLVNAEKHYHDYNNTVTPGWNGTVLNLSAISQGDTETTRTGNSIFARSLYIQMQINASTVPANTQFRYIIFIDRNANPGSVPSTGADLLENTGTVYATVSPLLFPEARNRYTILQDKHVSFSNTGKTAQYIKIYKNMRHHIKYVGTLGTDEGKGQIYILLISNDNTNSPAVVLSSRLMFMDN